ncbi:MAG TPA: hypothetical protein VGF34_10165, partial [Stellaceae bacterium]
VVSAALAIAECPRAVASLPLAALAAPNALAFAALADAPSPTAVASAAALEPEPQANDALPVFSMQPAAVGGGGTVWACTPFASIMTSATAAALRMARHTHSCTRSGDEN